jgi:hypothetical protein
VHRRIREYFVEAGGLQLGLVDELCGVQNLILTLSIFREEESGKEGPDEGAD